MPFEDFLQLEMLRERKPWITRYFEKMGIAAEITDIMYSTRSGDIRILTETEFTRLKLVTDLKGGQSLLEQLTK